MIKIIHEQKQSSVIQKIHIRKTEDKPKQYKCIKKLSPKNKIAEDNKKKLENDVNIGNTSPISVKDLPLKSKSEQTMNESNEKSIQLLTMIRKQYLIEKEITTIQVGELNSVLIEREIEENNKAKDNKIICDYVRKIHYESDPKKCMNLIYNFKKHELDERIKSYEKRIQQKDKENLQATIDMESAKNQVQYVKSLLTMINEGKAIDYIPKLKSKLKTINDKSSELEKNVQHLHRISLQHKNCNVPIRSSRNILEQLTKELENDKMFYGVSPTSHHRSRHSSFNDSLILNDNTHKSHMLVNKKIKMIHYTKNIIPRTNLQLASSTHILANKRQMNDSKSCLSIMSNKKSSEKTILFHPEERSRLAEFIPVQNIKEFEDRYKIATSLKSQINNKLRLGSAKKKEAIKFNIDRYNDNANKLIQQKKESVGLRHNLSKCKSEIITIKDKINEAQQKIVQSQFDLQKKNDDYNVLLNHLNKMRNEYSL